MTAEWQDAVLAGWRRGQALGAVGPGPVEDHLDHARAVAAAIAPTADAGLDLGTGVGIPGLALAGWRADMRWVLLDGALRRVRALADTISAAGWDGRVEAVHARAEVAGRDPRFRQRFDVVTARSFGPPAVTAEWAAPFVRLGGRIVVTEPPDAEPDRWPSGALAALGLVPAGRLAEPAIQVLASVGPPEARFPRKPGVARRRPLW